MAHHPDHWSWWRGFKERASSQQRQMIFPSGLLITVSDYTPRNSCTQFPVSVQVQGSNEPKGFSDASGTQYQETEVVLFHGTQIYSCFTQNTEVQYEELLQAKNCTSFSYFRQKQEDLPTENMELQVLQQTAAEQRPETPKPERGVSTAESLRGKLSFPIIYALLGLSILLSILTLGIVVSLITELGEMKRSDTGFRMDYSQWKRNVTQMLNEMKMSAAHTQTEFPQWKMNVMQILNEMKKSDADFRMEFFRWKMNATNSSKEIITLLTELQEDISWLKNNPPSCDERWVVFQQKKYHFSSRRSSWPSAQSSCKQMGADLVIIDNAEEQEFLKNNIQNQNHWIGLSISSIESNWCWVDGRIYNSSAAFWKNGEPHKNQTDGNCVEMLGGGDWNNIQCQSPRLWICEKSVAPPSLPSQWMQNWK